MSTPLRAIREKKGISVAVLGKALSITQSTINRIENARYHPSAALANRIAKYFNNEVTRDQILFPEDYVQPAAKPPVRARPQLRKAS